MDIDLKEMQEICLRPIADFAKLGDVIDTKDGQLVHVQRGAKILGVGHLDTVNSNDHFECLKLKDDEIVYSCQLDDRLGAYIMLDLLPKLGVKCDLLFTEGEEVGRSTAAHFNPKKHDYNWIFEFDRRGTDVVMYQFESAKMVKLLKRNGFTVGIGSFSDIAFLGGLGVKGFNFGTGYHNEHSADAHVYLSETRKMVGLFADFAKKMSGVKFEHAENNARTVSPRYHGRLDIDDDFQYGWDAKAGEFKRHSRGDVVVTTNRTAASGEDAVAAQCPYCGCLHPHHTEGCPSVTYAG